MTAEDLHKLVADMITASHGHVVPSVLTLRRDVMEEMSGSGELLAFLSTTPCVKKVMSSD